MLTESRKSTPALLTACATLVGFSALALCALCPISNGLLLRPLLAAFDSRYVSGHVEPIPFDRERWRGGKARYRVGIAHYLADNKLLNGKTRADLVEMLGEPDAERPELNESRWLLGFHAKGLFDESLWLEVGVGADGRAIDAAVATDWDDPRRR